MESWAAAFMLLGNQFKDLGLKADQGVRVLGDFSALVRDGVLVGHARPCSLLRVHVHREGDVTVRALPRGGLHGPPDGIDS